MSLLCNSGSNPVVSPFRDPLLVLEALLLGKLLLVLVEVPFEPVGSLSHPDPAPLSNLSDGFLPGIPTFPQALEASLVVGPGGFGGTLSLVNKYPVAPVPIIAPATAPSGPNADPTTNPTRAPNAINSFSVIEVKLSNLFHKFHAEVARVPNVSITVFVIAIKSTPNISLIYLLAGSNTFFFMNSQASSIIFLAFFITVAMSVINGFTPLRILSPSCCAFLVN